MIPRLLFLCALLCAAARSQQSTANILDYGAVPGDRSVKAAYANSNALAAAFKAALQQPPPRRVLIPAAASDFYVFNTTLANVADVTLQVRRCLAVDISLWEHAARGRPQTLQAGSGGCALRDEPGLRRALCVAVLPPTFVLGFSVVASFLESLCLQPCDSPYPRASRSSPEA
jgi:hypothetical protein